MLEVEKSVPDHIRECMEPQLDNASDKIDLKAATDETGTDKARLETEA